QPRKFAGASCSRFPASSRHKRLSRTGARPSLSNASQRAPGAAHCVAIHSALARYSPQRSSGVSANVLRRVRSAELTLKDQSRRERTAAPTRRLRVGIVDYELRAGKLFDVIHFRTFEVLHAQRIDQQLDTAAVEHEVVVCARLVETETILETRAAAALDEHAQLDRGLAFFGNQFAHACERSIGNPERGFENRGGGSIHG